MKQIMGFLQKIFSSKVLPSWTILLFDILICVVSVILAFLLRYSLAEWNSFTTELVATLVLTTVVNLVFFRVFRTYSNVLRLSSFTDIMHIWVALAISFLVCAAIALFAPASDPTTYLGLLSKVAVLLANEAFRAKVLASEDVVEIADAIAAGLD